MNPFAIESIEAAKSATNPADSNPYLTKNIQQETLAQARITLDVAMDSDPEQSARAARISRTLDAPYEAVVSHLPEMDKRVKLDHYERMLTGAPRTRDYLRDKKNADLSHDDVLSLIAMEMHLVQLGGQMAFQASHLPDGTTIGDVPDKPRTVPGVLGDIGTTLAKATLSIPQTIVGLTALLTGGVDDKAIDDRFGDETNPDSMMFTGRRLTEIQKAISGMYSPAQQIINRRVESSKGFSGRLVSMLENPSTIAISATESLPPMLFGGWVGRGLLKFVPRLSATGAAAIGEGVTGAGMMAEQIRQEVGGELSWGQRGAAVAAGVGTAIFGYVGGKLANRLGIDDIDTAIVRGSITRGEVDGVSTSFARKLIGGGISEGVFEELPQSIQEKLWENFALGKEDIFEGVGEAAAAGLVTGFSMGAGFAVPQHITDRAIARKVEEVRQLNETTTAWLTKLSEYAKASKTLARDNETVRSFVENVTEDGPVEHVYVDANTLAQSGLADQIAAISPSVAEQLPTAAATGAPIQIPIGEYTANLAASEYNQALVDHLKLPDPVTGELGMSKAEAAQFMETQGAELKAEVERILTDRQVDDDFKASQERVRQLVLGELNTVNRFTSAKNEVDATLIAARSAVRAAQLGMTPEQFFEKQRLRVQAERVDGQVFDQSLASQPPKGWGYPPSVDAQNAVERAAANLTPEANGGMPETVPQEGGEYFQAGAPNPVASLRGDELGEGLAKDNVVEKAREWFRKNLQGGVVNREGVGEVRISGKGWQKLKRGLKTDLDKARLIPAIPDVIKNGEYSGRVEVPSGSRKDDIVAFHHFEAPVKIGDAVYQVGVSVGEDSKGNLLYNLNRDPQLLLEKRKPSGDRGKALGAGLTEQGDESPELNQSIGQEDSEINLVLQQGQNRRGTFDPASSTMTLLKGADLSTFLHEAGHYFFEGDITLAGELVAKGDLTPGEQEIVNDVATLLTWHGVQGDIVDQLRQWSMMSFEERRSYHERTAESFEAYLFEGKAPSLELAGVFQKFRAWLMNVYRSLKDFLTRHPEAGKLDDTVRGVFDRMLATTEQIQIAQQARSMMPLFENPEQAGMTPEDFAVYQALGTEASLAAIEELQARGLRDMQWLHNAHGRKIKELQKKSTMLRRIAMMDARREVMSQPIYRAWQFLTAKIEAEDKIAPKPAPKSDPDIVDPSVDNLLVAIAKLGGIRRTSAATDLSIHKDQFGHPSGVFGKPLFRKDGGLHVDMMAEALTELGYLARDEDGRHDIRELEDKIHDAMAGGGHYAAGYDWSRLADVKPGEDLNVEAMSAGRFDRAGLSSLGLSDDIVNRIVGNKMVAKNGLHPDVVAELFGFTSGDELVRELAGVLPPKAAIEAATDVLMLERHGELSSPEAIAREADKAIHNDVRTRFIATEANALLKAIGQRPILNRAAKQFAETMIDRLKIRDVKPSRYTAAEVRAAKAAEKASKAGDISTAAAEKRNQLVNAHAVKAAYSAQDMVETGLAYLRKFNREIKTIDIEYREQIDALLDRFDLRDQTLKAIDRKSTLTEWIASMRDQGFEPDIPADLENEAIRKSYKNMTVEELKGLIDTVKQIEHLGRLKKRLLTAKGQREYEAVRDAIVSSINEFADGRTADTRTPTTDMGRWKQSMRGFFASHLRAATIARVLDGGKDGGVVWEYIVRPANEAGDRETVMRAEATQKLAEIMAPVFKLGKMGGAGIYFDSVGKSLNRETRIAIALNTGNEGNLQRLLDGEGWTMGQLRPVLESLTAAEWRAVQQVWDHLETYRPRIAEKERRVMGKEPAWVEARQFQIATADGQTLTLRGGYYPVKYDPKATAQAEQHADAEDARRQLQGAYTSATTRRSFVKQRAAEVKGRPLLYTLGGLYAGVNDVIHDLCWHEWLIDVNRLMRSTSIDQAIRTQYGPEFVGQLKSWIRDNAEGDRGSNEAMAHIASRLRQGVSAAGLGFNLVSALMQPLGITQSIVRVGGKWIGKGLSQYMSAPVQATRMVNDKSDFMANRARTRFRELNELRNMVQDQTVAREWLGRNAYWLMMRFQRMVDVPTWLGAYEKAVAEGHDEDRAIAIADQAVIDSQGGGQTKDLSAIERGGPWIKFFTTFYNFMGTAFNMGVGQTMTEKSRAKLAYDYLMLYVLPPVLTTMLKGALVPDDDDDWDMEKIAKKLVAEQISYLMGMMVVAREFSEVGRIVTGEPMMSYSGPAGIRLIGDTLKLIVQASQGEFDDNLRKTAVNAAGTWYALPSAQINRTITGVNALAEGDTSNPMAIGFGFNKRR